MTSIVYLHASMIKYVIYIGKASFKIKLNNIDENTTTC